MGAHPNPNLNPDPDPNPNPNPNPKQVRSLQWGVLSPTSPRSEGTTAGAPFGNPYSFADVDG